MIQYFKVFLESAESFLAWLNTALNQTIESYCDLETADNPTTFATHDGSLVSIIQIEGIKHIVEDESFQFLCNKLTTHLKSTFFEKGHTLQVVFHSDPQAILSDLKSLSIPIEKTNQRLKLGLTDLISERLHYLSKSCFNEQIYLILKTQPHRLNRTQSKEAEKNKLSLIRNKKLPFFRLTQNLIAAIPELRETHDALIQSTIHELKHLNIQSNLLAVHQAAKVIRHLVDPEFTDKEWKAYLPGDKIPLKEYQKYQKHIIDLTWPSLSRQLFPRDAENLDLRTVRIGDRIYASIFVDLLPKEIQPFSVLLRRTLNARIPWRISFLIESDALQALRFKALLANLLSFSSQENRLLSDAYNLLHYMSLNSDEAITQLRIVACTWACENQPELLRIRVAELSKAIQSWGMSDVSEISGDNFAGVLATLPGVLSRHTIATNTVLPFSQAVFMLPLARPASPWKQGSQLFRTPDGKIWPLELGSSQQTSWIDLIYARPGSGKSVLSNTLNLSLCLKKGLTHLPYIAIVDVGPSSKGLISLLKESISFEQRAQIAYHRLTMSEEYTINPFDTQLGLRYPLPQERIFLVNFLTLLVTPLDSDISYEGIADMIGLILDELYKHCSDEGQPFAYTAGIELTIDAALKKIAHPYDEHTTWWEVTDILFVHHHISEAILAQRHATPSLSDILVICRERIVTDLYGKAKLPTGEMLIDVLIRMISRAIREYPILSGVTKFDLNNVRIVALDLEDVAKGGGAAADRQTAVMYMLARYVLTRSCYLNESDFSTAPSQYYTYHQDLIQSSKENIQRLVFDEFHRTAKAKIVREQIIADMREGRKWNVQMALLSQSLEDFDSIMVELATAIYILDAGATTTLEKTSKIFGLTKEAEKLLKDQVHGPTSQGTTFLAQFTTTLGIYTQLLTLTLSPTELWALSTTLEDVLLRDKLYHLIGPINTRNLLARIFPQGSIKPLIEARLMEDKDTNKAQLIEECIQRVMSIYHEDFKSNKK